jgi:hypothetical protein
MPALVSRCVFEGLPARPTVLGCGEAFLSDAWPWRNAEFPGVERCQRSNRQFRLRLGMKAKGAKAKTLNARRVIRETLYSELRHSTKQANTSAFHTITHQIIDLWELLRHVNASTPTEGHDD